MAQKYLEPEKVKAASCDPTAAFGDSVLVDVYRDMQGFDIAPDPRNANLKAWYKQEERKANTTLMNRTSYFVAKGFFDVAANWKS